MAVGVAATMQRYTVLDVVELSIVEVEVERRCGSKARLSG